MREGGRGAKRTAGARNDEEPEFGGPPKATRFFFLGLLNGNEASLELTFNDNRQSRDGDEHPNTRGVSARRKLKERAVDEARSRRPVHVCACVRVADEAF